MRWFARCSLVVIALALAPPAFGQQPGGWSYPALSVAPEPTPPPPAPPGGIAEVPRPSGGFPTYAPERPAPSEPLPPPPRAEGQQHWVSLNLSVFQPFVGRIGLKVWPRANGSIWLEAFAGSVLFERMYGFGVRAQYTAFTFGSGGRVMVSPGVGVHILPTWSVYRHHAGSWEPDYGYRNSVAFLVGDVDVSWLHDFTPHFGYEIGIKLGLAGRVAGEIGNRYPRSVTFGRDLYPILALYSGFRF